jgi:hypothetical protein
LTVAAACSLPFTIAPVEPEEKIVYVEITSTPDTSTPTPLAANEPTPSMATPSIPVNMDGPWTIWQGTGAQQLEIDFLQQGFALVGNTATNNGESMLFKGTINQDGRSVAGTWESTSGTYGSFYMSLDASLTFFTGNLGGGVPLCGVRTGVTKPSTCLY